MKFENDDHQSLYDYWNLKKGYRVAPARRDIDPLDFHKILPSVFMYDVSFDPLDYRMRLFGSRLCEIVGEDYTDATFAEVHRGADVEMMRKDYDELTHSLKPSFRKGSASWINKEYLTYSRLLLPLSEDGQVANMILGLVILE